MLEKQTIRLKLVVKGLKSGLKLTEKIKNPI